MASNTKDGDDFWNTSSSSCFNFDDDEDSSEIEQEFVYQFTSQGKSVLPIQSIISKSCLDILLRSSDIKAVVDVPNADEAIRKMFIGVKCPLEPYKNLSEKVLLLDSAIKFKDGNLIIQVVLFLKSSLEQNVFHQVLSSRKQAVLQYAYELNSYSHDINAVPDLFLATGHFRKTPEEYIICASGLQQYTIRRDSKALKSKIRLNPDRRKVQILQWQGPKGVEAVGTVVEMLVKYCKHLIDTNKLSTEPLLLLKTHFEMDDMTFEWTVMNVLASMELWQKIYDYFIKPNWFTKKHVLKTTLASDKFVYGISRHKPPTEILENFLNVVSDSEKAVNLAKKLKCHKFVIQHYVNQKDRQALLNYKSKVVQHTEEYYLIEAALQATDKKWKN